MLFEDTTSEMGSPPLPTSPGPLQIRAIEKWPTTKNCVIKLALRHGTMSQVLGHGSTREHGLTFLLKVAASPGRWLELAVDL